MKIVTAIKTKEEARQVAINWQDYQSKLSMGYNQLWQWQKYFEKLAKKFKLVNEFKENGII